VSEPEQKLNEANKNSFIVVKEESKLLGHGPFSIFSELIINLYGYFNLIK